MRKRMLFVAQYFSIEPLGIHYLTGLVRDTGWDCKVLLIKNDDFGPLYDLIREWEPGLVGFQIWTGWHLQTFHAADQVRRMGTPVVIGGPHATYFHEDCATHADWVVKATGFELLRDILEDVLPHGIHFKSSGRAAPFPFPDRKVIYDAYPELAASPIKSMFGSVGCPFTCTYCYAPTFNEMHGGFRLTTRSVDGLIAEAIDLMTRWPETRLVYFQDDIFGYQPAWLDEFAARWKKEVGVSFHAQIRLELARGTSGMRRLDRFVESGCTGITLAIESGVPFIRDRVLFRHMDEETILSGCEAIMSRGMSLRTEQILAVPFSNTATDLATLDLNNRINPTMAWCSLLAPYGGTDVGTICANFGFHPANNDDLQGRSYERSLLQHPAGGPRDIEPIVENLGIRPNIYPKMQPLVNMRAIRRGDSTVADVWYQEIANPKPSVYEKVNGERLVGQIEYLDRDANQAYCERSFRLQRLFNFLAKVPDARILGQQLVSLTGGNWSWRGIGRVMEEHLAERVPQGTRESWIARLTDEMQAPDFDALPEPVRQNPFYFCFFSAGGTLAWKLVHEGAFNSPSSETVVNAVSEISRRHLFHFGLYKIESCAPPIAHP